MLGLIEGWPSPRVGADTVFCCLTAGFHAAKVPTAPSDQLRQDYQTPSKLHASTIMSFVLVFEGFSLTSSSHSSWFGQGLPHKDFNCRHSSQSISRLKSSAQFPTLECLVSNEEFRV